LGRGSVCRRPCVPPPDSLPLTTPALESLAATTSSMSTICTSSLSPSRDPAAGPR
jgi:hypothetical protein